MTQTGTATVEWNPEKKHWQVVIQVGAEVLRRQCAQTAPDAGDAELRALAIQTARAAGRSTGSRKRSRGRGGARGAPRGGGGRARRPRRTPATRNGERAPARPRATR